jgi:hypothetical protein
MKPGELISGCKINGPAMNPGELIGGCKINGLAMNLLQPLINLPGFIADPFILQPLIN